MHVHFEQNTCTRTDSNILSLSWMGKVPEDLPEEGSGWKLNRAQYYVEGWLASGNARGTVGVTFSTSHCHTYDAPPRSNFNLRGHRSEVVLVRWNEPYQKLATCDSRGVIFVWIKHEGRWSIELINDRNSQVTDFAWSHDGRMALICYRDGFILVGSVAGQRYWSSMLNLDNTSVTCGVWSPDDQQVMFGTVDGQIIVMSSAGALITQVAIHEGFEITSMAWSCEKFNMEEAEAGKDGADHGEKADDSSKSHVLAVCFKYGDIYLMSGYDDICPVMIYTTLTGVKIDWSNCGEYLAVGGFVRMPNLQCRNELHLYSKDGSLIRWVSIPTQGKPLTAMTWGHNDKRLFLAAGCHLYVAWISKQVVPLQFICQRVIHQSVRSVKAVDKLPLPQRLRCGVKALFSPTIKSYIPDPLRLREFVCGPPPGGERLFCTMIRHGEETSGGHYTLYLEYLGGLVPLLKGKRASKLRPDFIIYDPKIKSSGKTEQCRSNTIESDTSSESETDVFTDGCGSPRMQRRRKHKVFRADKVDRSMTFRTLDELMFDDNLPETNRLVEVTSNIWGTKFQITGVASSLPACLGQVVYKTSLLHLQPRQMTITIVEISPARPVLPRDPNFTPAPHTTDDEDEFWNSEADLTGEKNTVEVTVHDVPPLQSDDLGYKVEGSVADGGRRSISMHSPLIEHSDNVNGDPSTQPGKLSSTGTVRSRSLSPVWNSLTQTSSDVQQNGVCNDIRQDTNNSRGWQGARPKADPKKHRANTSSKSRGNNPKNSPRHSGTNKHTALSKSSHGNNYPTFHYANSSGTMTQTSTNNIRSFPSSPPATVSCKRKEVKYIDISNSVEKGVLDGVSIEGIRNMEPISADFRDNTALSQHFTGSSSTSTGNVMVPFVDTVKGEGPRWADPASPNTKLLEDGTVQASNAPLENNLVADCSPTAPNCLDLHRRLYLAQQNIVDTGTPISPSNCPSCLPVQSTSGPDIGASPLCVNSVAFSDHAAHTNLNSPVVDFKEGTSFESRLSIDSRQPGSEIIHNFTSSKNSDSEFLRTGSSALPNEQVLTSHREESPITATTCSNCLLQRSVRTHGIISEAQQIQLQLDSNLSGQDLCKSNSVLGTTGPEDVMPEMSVLHDQSNEPHLQDMTSTEAGSLPFPQTLQKHEGFHQQNHNLRMQSQSSHAHSRLPKDLSSFEKLSLILSEDPSALNSVHNFRSMPGFVMKNPDLKDDDGDSTSSEKDISENSDEQQTAPVSCNEDLLSNHIDIQHISASLPSSPIRFGAKQTSNTHNLHEEILKGRCKHLSPLLGRKSRDVLPPKPDFFGVDDSRLNSYETSEVFQKSHLKQKVRHRLNETFSRHEQTQTFTMHNKAPLWNETSQVYQLDFGGRVTQESAKNFQIELRGKQVMQFGRIDNNAYTLDFQHPFTAVQAFAVALANVTQRLK